MRPFLGANSHHAPSYRPHKPRNRQKHHYPQNPKQPGFQHVKDSVKHEPLETIYSIYEPTLNTQDPQKRAKKFVAI
jgi:hypothetical protein